MRASWADRLTRNQASADDAFSRICVRSSATRLRIIADQEPLRGGPPMSGYAQRALQRANSAMIRAACSAPSFGNATGGDGARRAAAMAGSSLPA